MKRKLFAALIATTLAVTTFAGCGNSGPSEYVLGSNQTAQTSTSTGNSGNGSNVAGNSGNADSNIRVTPTASNAITYTDYTTSEGYFNLKIPSGWAVETYMGDVLSYTLVIYDPNVPARRFVFCATSASYRSQAAIDLAASYDYTGADFSYCAISPDGTTSGYFNNSPQTLAHYGYSNYSEIANLGASGWGGDILQGEASYGSTEVEGIFTVATLNCGSMYYGSVDIGFNLDEGLLIMTAPKDEFPSWQPVLLEIFANMEMTDAYMSARAQAWRAISANADTISQMAAETSDIIMSGWESRNNTYDIMSQEYSDATMGRDRVYDTETGEVYYTDLGWYDSYSGSRYEYVESGSSYYNLPVSGTIEY